MVFQEIQNLSAKYSILGNLLKREARPFVLSGGPVTSKNFDILPYGYGAFSLNLRTRQGDVYLVEDWATVSFCVHKGVEQFNLSIDGQNQTFHDLDELQDNIRMQFKAELQA
jgi:hypothetical protein